MDVEDWERRVAEVWVRLDELAEDDFLARIEALCVEVDDGSGDGLFERAASLDSTGHPDQAVPRYREALALSLRGERRRRAVIQLASSLRVLGEADEAVQLLEAERAGPSDHLDDAVLAFLALALCDVGREREAASLALEALAPHLPRYQRSLGAYAGLLVGREPSDQAH